MVYFYDAAVLCIHLYYVKARVEVELMCVKILPCAGNDAAPFAAVDRSRALNERARRARLDLDEHDVPRAARYDVYLAASRTVVPRRYFVALFPEQLACRGLAVCTDGALMLCLLLGVMNSAALSFMQSLFFG